MVFVVPDSLEITPLDPYNTEQMSATVTLGRDAWDVNCGGLGGYTRTYIHLLRRNLDLGETWATAANTEVKLYDCYTQCCTDFGIITGGSAHVITFDPFVTKSPGKYEFMAVDDGDFKNLSFQPDRVAKATVTIYQDPVNDPCITNPCASGCPNALKPICTGIDDPTCDSGDFICELTTGSYSKYLPLIAGGALLVILVIIMPGKGSN